MASELRTSISRIVRLFVLVSIGTFAGWFAGGLFVFRNPIFVGTGALFLLIWAILMIAGGSVAAFVAWRMYPGSFQNQAQTSLKFDQRFDGGSHEARLASPDKLD